MSKIRIIPRLDIKGPNLIKSIQLEGLRVIGDPNIFAKKSYTILSFILVHVQQLNKLYLSTWYVLILNISVGMFYNYYL